MMAGKPNDRRTILAALLAFGMILYAMWAAAGYYNLGETISRIAQRGFLRSRSIARFEESFACLKDDLDPAEPVSFMTVAPSYLAIEYFQLAQYTLAPVLLDKGIRRPLIIVYVTDPDDMDGVIESNPAWQMIESCGDTVALFRRQP